MLHLLIAIYYLAEKHTSIHHRHIITDYMPMQSTHINVSFADISVAHRINISVHILYMRKSPTCRSAVIYNMNYGIMRMFTLFFIIIIIVPSAVV